MTVSPHPRFVLSEFIASLPFGKPGRRARWMQGNMGFRSAPIAARDAGKLEDLDTGSLPAPVQSRSCGGTLLMG